MVTGDAGAFVGTIVGASVGVFVGALVGALVGDGGGLSVGLSVGRGVGRRVGSLVMGLGRGRNQSQKLNNWAEVPGADRQKPSRRREAFIVFLFADSEKCDKDGFESSPLRPYVHMFLNPSL